MTMELGLQLRLARGYAIEPYELINILEMFGGEGSVPALDHDSGHESDSDVEIITPASSLSSSPSSSQSPSPLPSLMRQETLTPASYAAQMQQQQQQQTSSLASPSSASPSSASRLVEILQVETRNPHFHDTTKGEEHVQDMQLQGLKALYHSSLATPALQAQLRRYMTENLGLVLAPGEEPPRERTYPPLASALDFAIFHDVLTAQSGSLRQFGLAAEVDVLLADRGAACLSGGGSRRTGAGAGVGAGAGAAVGIDINVSGSAGTNGGGYRRSHNPRRRFDKPAAREQKIHPSVGDDDHDRSRSRRSSSDGWQTSLMQ